MSGSPVLSTTAQGNSSPGSYPITILPGTLNATNYTFQGFVPATLTIIPAAGNHSISAVYQGDTNYAGSSAGPISQMVYRAAPAIRVSRTAPIHRAPKKKAPPPKHPARTPVKVRSLCAHTANARQTVTRKRP